MISGGRIHPGRSLFGKEDMILFPRTSVILLICVLAAMVGAAPARGADTAAEKKKLERIKREMQEKKREIRKADRKERSVLAELEKIDKGIQSGMSELTDQQGRLQSAEAALRDVERNASLLRQELDGVKGVYRSRVRALYMMGNRNASSVFAFDGFQGALRRMKYLTAIAERDHEIITKYSESLDRLERRQEEIAGRKEDIERRKHAAELKKAELEAKKRSKHEMLASVRKQKALYEQTIDELEEASTNLWTMIRKAEEQKQARQRTTVRSKPTPEPKASSATKGRLPWPVAGEVVTRFGVQNHPRFGTRVFKRGIEISTRTGKEVRAVNDGQVAFADWYRGFGKLMIIEHGPGLHTLYGHLGRIDANKGDVVRRGQVIGIVGDTGTQEGPKLYFELRSRGEAQDPLQWLTRR